AVVLEGDALVRRILPQEDIARDVHRILLQDQFPISEDVRIGQLDRQQRIVIADIGAEQHWLHAVYDHFQIGQESGVAMEKPVLPADRGAEVAVAVEQDESVIMLERAARARILYPSGYIEWGFREPIRSF